MWVDLGSCCNKTNPQQVPRLQVLVPLDDSCHTVNDFQIIWGFFVLNCKDNQEITTFEFRRF